MENNHQIPISTSNLYQLLTDTDTDTNYTDTDTDTGNINTY